MPSIAGPGATSTPVLRFSFHLNPGYSTINASQQRPTGTLIGQPDSTRRGGRTSPFALLSKCSTWRVSLQEPAGTTNDFCMNAIGLSGITPARGPRQRVIGNPFSAALFARRMPPQRNDHIFRFCQHPLLMKARLDSDSCLGLLPLPTNLDRRLLPALLLLLASKDGHRICLGKWSSSQISQLDLVLSSVHAKPWISTLGYPRYRNYPWIIRYG